MVSQPDNAKDDIAFGRIGVRIGADEVQAAVRRAGNRNLQNGPFFHGHIAGCRQLAPVAFRTENAAILDSQVFHRAGAAEDSQGPDIHDAGACDRSLIGENGILELNGAVCLQFAIQEDPRVFLK